MKKGLYYAVFKTGAGWMGILGSDRGLQRTTLPKPTQAATRRSLGDIITGATPSAEYHREIIKRFQDYFTGHPVSFPDRLDLSLATDFRRRVWEATRRIPYGETRSYAWVAAQLQQPGAARAVGQALGKNPLPVIIPCHRVITSNGCLGGFTGGLEMKRYLISAEASIPARHPVSHRD